MTDVSRQVENIINAAYQMINHIIVAYIAYVKFYAILDGFNIEVVAALIRHERIHNKNINIADLGEPVSQIATYESKPARDKYGTAFIFGKRFRDIHSVISFPKISMRKVKDRTNETLFRRRLNLLCDHCSLYIYLLESSLSGKKGFDI